MEQPYQPRGDEDEINLDATTTSETTGPTTNEITTPPDTNITEPASSEAVQPATKPSRPAKARRSAAAVSGSTSPSPAERRPTTERPAPPTTFAEAEDHNAYLLLRELYEHALLSKAEYRQQAGFHLAELALSSAVISRWSAWQPITMHRALVAGASLAEVAAATGTTEAEVYTAWSEWTKDQAQLVIGGWPGVAPGEVAEIQWRLARPQLPKLDT